MSELNGRFSFEQEEQLEFLRRRNVVAPFQSKSTIYVKVLRLPGKTNARDTHVSNFSSSSSLSSGGGGGMQEKSSYILEIYMLNRRERVFRIGNNTEMTFQLYCQSKRSCQMRKSNEIICLKK